VTEGTVAGDGGSATGPRGWQELSGVLKELKVYSIGHR
jgi:hypothetical protein